MLLVICLGSALRARGDTLSVATSPHPLVQIRDHVIKGIELDNVKQPRAALREFEVGMQICERSENDGVSENAQQARRLLTESREQVRRVSHELMPPEFTHAHLGEIIEDYVREIEGTGGCALHYE